MYHSIQNRFLALLVMLIGTTGFAAGNSSTGQDVSSRQLQTNATTMSSFDVGAAVFSGTALPGVEVTWAKQITHEVPLFAGIDLGAFVTTTDSRGSAIPVMPSAFFLIDTHSVIQPIVGISAGVVIDIGRGNDNGAEFGALFRPGLNARISKSFVLNVETRFGVIDSKAVFLPLVGVTTIL